MPRALAASSKASGAASAYLATEVTNMHKSANITTSAAVVPVACGDSSSGGVSTNVRCFVSASSPMTTSVFGPICSVTLPTNSVQYLAAWSLCAHNTPWVGRGTYRTRRRDTVLSQGVQDCGLANSCEPDDGGNERSIGLTQTMEQVLPHRVHHGNSCQITLVAAWSGDGKGGPLEGFGNRFQSSTDGSQYISGGHQRNYTTRGVTLSSLSIRWEKNVTPTIYVGDMTDTRLVHLPPTSSVEVWGSEVRLDGIVVDDAVLAEYLAAIQSEGRESELAKILAVGVRGLTTMGAGATVKGVGEEVRAGLAAGHRRGGSPGARDHRGRPRNAGRGASIPTSALR